MHAELKNLFFFHYHLQYLFVYSIGECIDVYVCVVYVAYPLNHFTLAPQLAQ